MTAPTTATAITPELKSLLRRVKLGKTLDSLSALRGELSTAFT